MAARVWRDPFQYAIYVGACNGTERGSIFCYDASETGYVVVVLYRLFDDGFFPSYSNCQQQRIPASCCRPSPSVTIHHRESPRTNRSCESKTVFAACHNDCDTACCYCDIARQQPLCMRCCGGEP
ncbi:hypothetical protein M569_02970 [Genlisea aurea]|uniref:Uncharacterized protein n=1 Tax=Genlisea aurea TaxID=192259 RepID=S8CXS9_9LAMI|nr:hypothetical protein M569_02970 [Genlisea aurea]